jgi:sporulation protein YlmC with PRC-barrel domain
MSLVPMISVCALVAALFLLGTHHVTPPPPISTTVPATPLEQATTTPMLSTRALLGMPVTTQDGTRLGSLDDLVLDATDDHIVLVIVAASGWLGLGGRFMALPWGMVRPAADGRALVITLGPALPRAPLHREGPDVIAPTLP